MGLQGLRNPHRGQVVTFTAQSSHLFQQRISCLPIGASGSRHTNVSLLLSVTLKKTQVKPTHLLTLIWMHVYAYECVAAGCGTHITVILSQLGLFGWTWRFFSCPLTPRCVSGHLHLPGTNVPSDCLAAHTQTQ